MFFRCQPDDEEIRRIMRAENTERMIKEKLMMGWTFDDLSCFVCDTPLVVNTTVRELPPDGTTIAKPTSFSAQAIGTFIKINIDRLELVLVIHTLSSTLAIKLLKSVR